MPVGVRVPPFAPSLLLFSLIIAALLAFPGCKSEEEQLLDESFALHEQVYAVLDEHSSDATAAIARLVALEEETRNARQELNRKLSAALEALDEEKAQAFREKAIKRHREMAARMAAAIKEFPQDKQARIQSLISTITR